MRASVPRLRCQAQPPAGRAKPRSRCRRRGPGRSAEAAAWVPILRTVRRLPDLTRRLVQHEEAAHRLGGAVPSPAVAFLLAIIALPALFWLVMLKRTTVFTAPEEWLMTVVVPGLQEWVRTNVPPLEVLIVGISAPGSGWFLALAFAVLGLLALTRGRRDLALLLALGTLCFPIEWMLKYFTSSEVI